MRPFSIVVAFDSQYGIGKNGQLAWNLPSDLKHFKEITTTVQNPAKKNAVIMGRKTWDSLPAKFRPLPGRVNVVLTKQLNLSFPEGVLVFDSLEGALKHFSSSTIIESAFVIGGAQVFNEAMSYPLCQKLYVTHVEGQFDCDTFFPPISKQFIPISSSETLHEGGVNFQFSDYLKYS